ncbi:flavin reductase family protein [Arthrobacter sp. I2-34]|uniref:Flavin reductase family protein n=1 Tax=Arthrobacter hankyongi TaxID=2904801 RepID=A0ABS9LBW4_9MICC|nr:flavin reductase family protein [Arthrobacter hankyongi]MCG2624150.1 flavin reductase family protein [Arthrobacter hankyongi]
MATLSPDTIAPGTLRGVMRRWMTGVTVVTAAGTDGRPAGLVSNSFTSVSLQPPLVSWCADRGSRAIATWSTTEAFAVHVLAESDAHLVPRFASRGGDKFAGLATGQSAVGAPSLAIAGIRLDCRLWARYDGGDHLILVGQVLAIDGADEFDPLTLEHLNR